MHVPHKFAPRAKHCVFLGYLVSRKAYKLYDLATHQVFNSCDVVFHENIFPYESTPSTFTNSTPIIPLPMSDPFSSRPLSTIQQTPPPELVPPPTPVPLPHSSPVQPTHTSPPPTLALRRSQQPHVPPTTLRDYVCN